MKRITWGMIIQMIKYYACWGGKQINISLFQVVQLMTSVTNFFLFLFYLSEIGICTWFKNSFKEAVGYSIQAQYITFESFCDRS